MRIAIIGAGAAGMAAAYDLAKNGHDVHVFESGSEVGGLAAGFKDTDWDWYLEKFYHHWFSNDDAILGLLDELGLGYKVEFFSPVTSLWHTERVIPLDRPVTSNHLVSRALNILTIREIPLLARLRFGLMGLVLTLINDGTFLEKFTADEWSRKWVGRAAHDLIWKPMLIGKFGPLYDRVNMAWLWARVYKRTPELGTYQGGFQAALNDIAEALQQMNVTIHFSSPVTCIGPLDNGGFEVELEGGHQHYDYVLSTASPGLGARLVPDLPEYYKKQLTSLKSMGAQCLVLALDRQLMSDGTYWLNLPASEPNKSRNPFPFLALVEHTNALDLENYGGQHLLYLGDYLEKEHPYFQMPKDELADLYLPSLNKVNPEFSREWIQKMWLFRAPYAQPVPIVNQSQHIPALRTPLQGLYFASMSQVYPWDRGTNYAVEIGRYAARLMLEDIGEGVSIRPEMVMA